MSQFVFSRLFRSPAQYYVSNVDGTHLHAVFQLEPKDKQEIVGWTPDGTGIAYIEGDTLYKRRIH